MDTGKQWYNSSFRTPTDSGPSNRDYQIFDGYIYAYLLKRNLYTTAQIFKQEAQIGDIRSMLLSESPGDFLFDWWTIFNESYTARFNASQGNYTALFSQVGQSSSMYDLPARESMPIPQVNFTAPLPRGFPVLESSPLSNATTVYPPVQPASHGSPQVCGPGAIPPASSTSNVSAIVSGPGAMPLAWWADEGSHVPAAEQVLMPVYPVLNYLSPGSSNAIVLTAGNVNSGSPVQFPQPRPLIRGVRRGTTPNDPIDVEGLVASPTPAAPRGRSSRSRRQLQSQSRGSSVSRANVRPPAGLMRTTGSMGMSPSLAQYSRSQPFLHLQANSTFPFPGNYYGACGSFVPSSLGMGSQLSIYGPLLSAYQERLASTSLWNSGNATNDQNSIPTSHHGTVGFSTVPHTLPQGMPFDTNVDGLNTETLGQRSITHAGIVSHETGGPSNPHADMVTVKIEEVSSGSPMQEKNMKGTYDDSEEDHKEDDTAVGKYFNDIYGTETDADPDTDATTAVMASQPNLTLSQPQQPSQMIKVRDEAGFDLKQEACLESNLSERCCCHFSSSGKYLACAGVDRKVIVWNTVNLVCTVSEEQHDEHINDIRFKPNSSIFATASSDKTIRIWDATKSEKALLHLTGHAGKVTSVDFHPTQFDILSSCSENMEIRFWHVNNRICLYVTKVASQQVRFQTQKGKYLAVVTGNTISILESETGNIMQTLLGHIRPIECICWDSSGRYLASASEESVHIWSITNWCDSTHTLKAENGKKFKCCIFHPSIPNIVIIGYDKNIELWNPMDDSRKLVASAHESYVAGLTSCISTGIIASTSLDGRVKLWK